MPLLHWIVTAVALGVATYFVPGIHITSGPVLVFAALVLGFVNAVVRPVLVVLTLPLTVLTLGFFYLIVNGAAFGLAAALVPGFTVASLGSAVLGSIVVALVSWVFAGLIRRAAIDARSRRARSPGAARHGTARGPAMGHRASSSAAARAPEAASANSAG